MSEDLVNSIWRPLRFSKPGSGVPLGVSISGPLSFLEFGRSNAMQIEPWPSLKQLPPSHSWLGQIRPCHWLRGHEASLGRDVDTTGPQWLLDDSSHNPLTFGAWVTDATCSSPLRICRGLSTALASLVGAFDILWLVGNVYKMRVLPSLFSFPSSHLRHHLN